MNLLLIKLGKAMQTIKRDGFIRGGRRVLQAGISMFGRVSSGDILFITGGVGDSSRYRGQHQAEELEQHGLKCSVTVQDNPFLATYADEFQIFIFQRTLNTPTLAKLISRIKEQKKTIIFSTDDLVFDESYFEHMNYLQNANKFEKKLYEKGVGQEILADPYTSAAVTTTTFLKDKIEQFRAKQAISNDQFPIFISRNKLCQQDMEIAESILARKNNKADELVRIGYFSGTISHNADFALVTPVLLQLLEKYKNLRLVIVGPLDVDNALNKYSDQVEHLTFVSRDKHFFNIASVDINISPLEKNPFCEAKSELKWFEAGLVEVPTVASATQTFREAINDGVDGYVADGSEQWMEKLERLINDKSLRRKIGQHAREKILQYYVTTGEGNEDYNNFLKSKINRTGNQQRG